MVFVKVRETYDLHTIKNKISMIGIHTPDSGIIKRNYPGLLLQCKAYRPVSADVRLACASMMPLDPQGVGTSEGDVAPEDVFNPILYKAMSNFGMSQVDRFIAGNQLTHTAPQTLDYDNDLAFSDESGNSIDSFDIYYGLLSQTHEWKHANPQQGLQMSNLKPLVYEVYQTYGDNPEANPSHTSTNQILSLNESGTASAMVINSYRGSSHPLPMLNCTTMLGDTIEGQTYVATQSVGFGNFGNNAQVAVPAPKVFVGCIIVPPSRLHQLFYRLVVEWTLEFSMIRPLADLMTFKDLATLGANTHYISYSYDASNSKLVESTGMVDTTEGSDIKKVM